MANNETMQEKVNTSPSEAFSYSWYPTQCEIGASSRETASTTNGSLSQDSYRVFKTDTDDEIMVVQQDAPQRTSQRSTQYVINLSNKFTDQQVKVLMKTWKELYDRRQHFRTSESDWHDITDKVNMAPGSAKTVKQVKKKFKNLRDRYRASKIKNKKRNFGFSKTISFAQFEQVYGELDKQSNKQLPRNGEGDDLQSNDNTTTRRRAAKPPQLQKAGAMQADTTRNSSEQQNALEMRTNQSPTYSHAQSTRISAPNLTVSLQGGSSEMGTGHSQGQTCSFPASMPHSTTSLRGTSLEATDFRSGVINSFSPIATSTGARHPFASDILQQDSQLVNAVRELQQQQITMQRELMRSMKQMEERILGEMSIKIRESEDQSRQQIANALTQLGNLIRIT